MPIFPFITNKITGLRMGLYLYRFYPFFGGDIDVYGVVLST